VAGNAEHFPDTAIGVGEMMEAVVDEREVNGVVTKGKILCVADDQIKGNAEAAATLTGASNCVE
jgi:hypothetical protein